ncbi:MAG: putative Ig domain-containing protein, partial [Planctomycetes bacterium]|nr:putative Ig domain-containing protein [Planctomycetota bacterium]
MPNRKMRAALGVFWVMLGVLVFPAFAFASVEDFETGNFSQFGWQNNGRWAVVSGAGYNSTYGAKVYCEQYVTGSWDLWVTMPCTAGNISFYRYEYGYGTSSLIFYIDGVQKGSWQNVSWGVVTYTVTAGTHTFKWRASKSSTGDDATYKIDYITFPEDPAMGIAVGAADASRPIGGSAKVAGQITCSTGPVGKVLNSLKFTGAGTGNEYTDIASAKLYQDTNGNGILDGGESQLGTSQVFTADNGTILFSNLGITINARSSLNMLMCYDMVTTCLTTFTYQAKIISSSDVSANELGGGASSVNGSFPINCAVKTMYRENFETGTLTKFPWTWLARWEANASAGYQDTWGAQVYLLSYITGSWDLNLTRPCTAGNISFYRYQSGYGTGSLKFYIDGVLKGSWSDQGWAQVSYSIARGVHTFTWIADKTTTSSEAYYKIDDIEFPWVSTLFITSTTPLPDGLKNTAYSQTFTATNGQAPYTWSKISGSFPPGINLNSSTGELYGTPTISGTYNFRIRVTDNLSATDGMDFSLYIKPWDILLGGDHEGQDWTLNTNTTIGGEHYGIGQFTIDPSVTISFQSGSGMGIDANDVVISGTLKGISRGIVEINSAMDILLTSTGKIDVTDLAYGGTDSTSTKGADAPNYTVGGGGGGYGGEGGDGGGYSGSGGGTRGTRYFMDIAEGSKGGNVPLPPDPPPLYKDPYGGMGGIAILVAGNIVTVDGKIWAYGNNGQDGIIVNSTPTAGGGGGSGGGIMISAMKVYVNSSAELLAYGGNGGAPASGNNNGGGGGGGGRIKIFGSHIHPDAYLSVSGGNHGSASAQNGHPGTIMVLPLHRGYCSPCEALPGGVTAAIPVGSSVNVTSGNLNIDLDITNINPVNSVPHNISIYYNSAAENTTGPLGPKWTHTFNQRIEAVISDTVLAWVDGSGRKIAFDDINNDYVYESYPVYGLPQVVLTDTGTGYVLQAKDRTKYYFNSGGLLTNIQCPRGNAITCTYNAGLLASVALPDGNRVISVYYNANSLINQLIDPAGNITTLAYNGNNQLQYVRKDSGSWE